MAEGPASRAVAELRRRIVMNELTPGTLLTELGLAGDLACSQAAVREALLRLEGEGLVLRSGRQGTTVTDLDADTAAEILDLRRRIELRGARRGARRAGAGDILALRRIQAAMEQAAAAGDAWAVLERDMDLHLALFRLSGLHAMGPILARCILHTHRFRLWAPWHRRPLGETARRHVPILEALEAGDAAALARELAGHLDTMVDRGVAAA
ncbi:GntR family transcriptional regulator [Limobrevibacterium gyesilva]|uniref:GntR family transcriptional regulator n=1 Tax=Limobrevibacterium gyesilva TaxID=2991712 RepID=A0AA41YKV2_9PROT|nr:GntR family transcriptional regulator [Limobrevibacterium gyesilva]MCW3474082.1 GntR family transcriptional regulator [Limobrevibacterium gyesilva]